MARMELTDQKHPSDSIVSKQEDIRGTEKTAWLFGLDEQNVRAYKALSGQIRELEKKLDNYHSEYNSFKKTVRRLERNEEDLYVQLLDKCVDRETVVNLIHKIVPILINEKSKGSAYSFESSEDSDLVEIIEKFHGYWVREERAVPHAFVPLAKQQSRARSRKVKQDPEEYI
ncbi:hypothetical protein RhiirA4_482781 [Rhizophagus irregularis]|uniref:Uncharacterized protein n=1 Tax=Rhizophagus irregularis TaxID=588596 RepID=A0A2I1HLM5_9GLOM|nr:hypothetical protein RhiirA4_482781 [Rhizophagus irregularis]